MNKRAAPANTFATQNHSPLHSLRQAEVEIAYRAPRQFEWKRWRINISEIVARDLEPLPATRELYWEVDAHRITAEMMQARRRLAQDVAAQLTDKLLEAFGVRDTINGYSREQWAEMHQQAPSVEGGNEV